MIAWPHIAITRGVARGRARADVVVDRDERVPEQHRAHARGGVRPDTTTFQTVDNNFHDMFCAGVSTLEDGRIVAAGGNPYDTRTSAFNPATLTWQALANMNSNRWYGTLLALPSNELFSTFANAGGNTSERYNPASNAWTLTPGATMQDLLNEQNAENGQIDGQHAPPGSSGGARWRSAPDGRVLHGGPTQTWHLFDPRGSGAVQSLGQPAGTRTRMWGNAVTYGAGKVLILGGTRPHRRTRRPPTRSTGST